MKAGWPLSRRAFVRGVLAAPAAACLAVDSAAGSTAFRVILLGTPTDEELRGVRFGAAEAGVAAKLMGHELRLGSGGSDAAAAIGVIVAAGGGPAGDLPANVPVILLNDAPALAANACAFRVGVNNAEREAALARWRVSTGAPSSSRPTKDSPRVVEWHHSLTRYGASELNERFAPASGGDGMTAVAWSAWFAVKALVDSALRAKERASCAALARGRFDGHKGRPLAFDAASRVLRQPLYVVAGPRGSETVIAELAPEAA